MRDWEELELELPRVVRKHAVEGRGIVDYHPPLWADFNPKDVLGKDVYRYSVDIISNGTFLENVKLGSKSYCILGSMDDCDFVYKNPLVSRKHLVLQLNRHGSLLLYDLCSTHGTTLNHVRIEPDKYYMLKVGDQIRIGLRGSTSRTYVVCGPEESDPLQEDVTSDMKPKKKAKTLAEKDEQEIMAKVKNATAADYYDTHLYFDEWDDYFDRDQVKQESSAKRKQKTHTAASLKADLAKLCQEEIDILNRWYDIIKQAKEEGLIREGDVEIKAETLVKKIQKKGLNEDRAKLQDEVNRIREDIEYHKRLLRLTRTEC
ncbi:Kanadaptin [Babesia sp. Xinjiang]|uniref:Kanadaptin n=1 Tax=Babesia sp. Xinjiang TaxID=462227 RepID=UPI000A24A86A|nr:Kanadaptin [Babesia sp. Xinjiang]ORM40061.1 Kanadaptin [Babesia sp. Xinjiang]